MNLISFEMTMYNNNELIIRIYGHEGIVGVEYLSVINKTQLSKTLALVWCLVIVL